MPCAVKSMASESALLKMRFWPKLRKDRLVCVFMAAFS